MDIQNILYTAPYIRRDLSYQVDAKLNHKEFEKIKILNSNSKQKYKIKNLPQKSIKKNYIINKKENFLNALKLGRKKKKKMNILSKQNPIKCVNKINLLLIYLMIIINLFMPILANSHYRIRQNSLLNEVTIKIIGTDTQNILYENYTYHPDEIYIQGDSYIIDEKNRIMNLTNYENYITMKWNYKLTDCLHMFYGLSNIIEIDLTNLDLSQVTVMNSMFKNCNNLEYIKFNNSKNKLIVSDISNMFEHCISLKTLDLSNFDSSKVSNMISTFLDCWSLISLNLNGFNTSSVIYFTQTFYNCSSLTSLDLSSFDTSQAVFMNLMFFKCSSLKSINLLNFKTKKVYSLLGMFYQCSNLTSLDISNFDTSSTLSITIINFK